MRGTDRNIRRTLLAFLVPRDPQGHSTFVSQVTSEILSVIFRKLIPIPAGRVSVEPLSRIQLETTTPKA